jgi:hypothetical protein
MTSLPDTLSCYIGCLVMPERGNEIADKFARGGSFQCFVGPESFLGVSKQNI